VLSLKPAVLAQISNQLLLLLLLLLLLHMFSIV
jgi:hypothetical protein